MGALIPSGFEPSVLPRFHSNAESDLTYPRLSRSAGHFHRVKPNSEGTIWVSSNFFKLRNSNLNNGLNNSSFCCKFGVEVCSRAIALLF